MQLFRSGCALALFIVGFAVVGRTQDQKTFPTDDEINLLLTQTDRAVQQYKSVIDQEQIEMGKSYAEAVARDRQVVNALEGALKALKAHPQGFNAPGGFAVILWLDDADRNALLCASGAMSLSTLKVIAGDSDKANNLTHLSQTCMNASSLLYTVSENASSLYLRYVEGEEQLAAKGLETAQKCMDILKKNGITPEKQSRW
jgi:hypothetical protein